MLWSPIWTSRTQKNYRPRQQVCSSAPAYAGHFEYLPSACLRLFSGASGSVWDRALQTMSSRSAAGTCLNAMFASMFVRWMRMPVASVVPSALESAYTPASSVRPKSTIHVQK